MFQDLFYSIYAFGGTYHGIGLILNLCLLLLTIIVFPIVIFIIYKNRLILFRKKVFLTFLILLIASFNLILLIPHYSSRTAFVYEYTYGPMNPKVLKYAQTAVKMSLLPCQKGLYSIYLGYYYSLNNDAIKAREAYASAYKNLKSYSYNDWLGFALINTSYIDDHETSIKIKLANNHNENFDLAIASAYCLLGDYDSAMLYLKEIPNDYNSNYLKGHALKGYIIKKQENESAGDKYFHNALAIINQEIANIINKYNSLSENDPCDSSSKGYLTKRASEAEKLLQEIYYIYKDFPSYHKEQGKKYFDYKRNIRIKG